MSTNLRAVMASHQQMIAICHDRDLDANAKLFALCATAIMYDNTVSTPRQVRVGRRRWLSEVCDMAGRDAHWARRVVRDDVPRYVPPEPDGYCTEASDGREGRCGKPAVVRGIERDPLTGEGTAYGYCSRHRNHDDDWRIKQQFKQWNQNGRPEPAPNAGGVLPRYIDIDWDRLYQWAAPSVACTEGAKLPTVRPKLVVIRGGINA
ncbi:hypothetical protein KL864_31840 [Mycolicibacterium goodii]|uniref:hypothetical protein n=1 Tax=Mycolicibacterium goodii TaxID=134601 RepID=UPI001BDD9149|nr:hypothetical protein [Mycolicibacterium goodii]MBU8820469.1 hypothetical protein [Mycolicibacterium goodii]